MRKHARSVWVGSLLAIAEMAFATVPADAKQYHTEVVQVDVEVWPEKIWDYFRFFCDPIVSHFESTSCTEGGGGVGSIRVFGDGQQDLLVAVGPLWQTYETIAGPLGELDLHVTLSVVQREDPLTSTITATLIWDDEPIPADERLAMQYHLTAAMRGDLTRAKDLAEAS